MDKNQVMRIEIVFVSLKKEVFSFKNQLAKQHKNNDDDDDDDGFLRSSWIVL